jgi:hypothetical protein
MITWERDIGYNEDKEPVAFLHYDFNKQLIKVKVRGGEESDNYFVGNTVSPSNSAAIVAAKKLAEVTYRIIKNQPDQNAAQVALRVYAKMKGIYWWQDDM